MTYDPSDGTSLTELIRLVRRRLGDSPTWRKKQHTGDGVETRFFLDDDVVEDSATCTVDGVDTGFTLDYDSGWATFTSAPTGDVVFRFQRVVWTDERITEAINAAIDQSYQWFTVAGENDALYTDGNGELLVETSSGYDLGPEDRITKVEYWTGSRWTRLDSWHVRSSTDLKYIVFENIPAPGQRLRVSYVVRPGNLDTGSQTLEGTAGLPSRAKDPLVLFTCADLLMDRLNRRIRDDRGHNTQSENPVKSYEIQNDANALRAEAELKASRLRGEKLSARVRY